MAGFPWLRFLEAWMVQQLLRTPGFHRAVEKVAKGVHRLRHGIPPAEMGGSRLEQPASEGFMKHFLEEVKTQLGTAERQESTVHARGTIRGDKTVDAKVERGTAPKEENADAAWQTSRQTATEPPNQGFMGEYIDALREQVRGNQPRK